MECKMCKVNIGQHGGAKRVIMEGDNYCVDCGEILKADWYEEDKDRGKIDIINHPPHYTKGGIQPIDYIIGNNLDFCEGNIVKYITRHKYKNGLEDLKKVEFYIKKLISNYKKNESK